MKKSHAFIISFALIIIVYINHSQLKTTQEPTTTLSQNSTNEMDKTNTQNNTQTTQALKSIESIDKPTSVSEDIDQSTQSQPLRVITRPTWKLTGDIATKLKTLEQAATNGNSEASYQLAMNYKYCFHAAKSEQQLEEKLQQAYEFADSDKAIDNIKHKYQYCKSITEQQRRQYYQYLINAAQNGQVAAQEAIGNITEHQYMKQINKENLNRDERIAKRDRFIAEQLQQLESAAKHGSIKALIKLSNMQYSQNYGPNGYLKAYAYNQIILELTDDNQIHNRYSWYQQKIYDQLTSAELDQADQIVTSWLKQIKNNGTVYLN